MGQDVFVSGYEASKAFVITSGYLTYDSIFDEYEEHLVLDGHWIAEVSIWIRWLHCGRLSAASQCRIVELNGADLQVLMRTWGGPLCDCLKRFAVFLLGHLEGLASEGQPVTDMPLPRDLLCSMAE